MKVEMAAVLAGLLACTAATLEELFPFHEVLHTWWAALLAGLIAAGLVAVVVTGAVRGGRARLASIAALGGAVLAGGIVLAAMVGGAPQRVPAVPGQTYRAAHGGSVAVVFPLIDPADPPARWPSSVIVDDGRRAWSVKPGTAARAGAFVFSVAAGPIAFVDATTPNGEPVT
ncbi:MAG TPA: hypothetical protein VEJ20_06830, partial [Candidatus Eremiobacteraceae bacterium]|nr:hypothetical protein [Candidatus Eremiobacteraceae bacterium]